MGVLEGAGNTSSQPRPPKPSTIAPSSNQTGGSGVNGTWSLGDISNAGAPNIPYEVANPSNDAANFPHGDPNATPTNINPLGGVATGGGGRGGGGGGGGGTPAPPGIDQTTYDRWLRTVGNYTPSQYEYTPYEWQDVAIDDYKGTGFYDWDPSLYNTTREGIDTGMAKARKSVGTALDGSAAAYGGMGNAYAQGPQTFNQGVDPRVMNTMRAFGGAGMDAAMQNQMEGAVADAGFGSFYDLMAKGTDQYNSAMVNSVNGDRVAAEQNLGSQEAMMKLQVNMAEQKAKSQYEKDKWMYGEEIARQNYEKNMQVAMANNAGQNQVGAANNQGMNQAQQANALSSNQFDQQSLQSLMDLWMAGIDPTTGKQTLDLGGGNGSHILQNIWAQKAT